MVNENGSMTLENLSLGEYTVLEENVTYDGLSITTTYSVGEDATNVVSLETDGDLKTVEVTNDVTEVKGSLIVSKRLGEGSIPEEAANKDYKFTVMLKDSDPKQYVQSDGTLGANPYEFTVKAGSSTSIEGIPNGDYVVSEIVDDAEIDGYTLIASGGGDVTVDVEYTHSFHKVHTCSDTEFSLNNINNGLGFIVVKSGSDWVIWTHRAMNDSEREMLVDFVKSEYGSFKEDSCDYVSGTPYEYDNGAIKFSNSGNKLIIDFHDPSIWSQFGYGVFENISEPATSELINTYVADTSIRFNAKKTFEHGDLSENPFTFTAYEVTGTEEEPIETVAATGSTVKPAEDTIADSAQDAVQAVTETDDQAESDGNSQTATEDGDSSESADAANSDGTVYFTPIQYTLDDLKQDDGSYASSKTFKYVIKEDIPETAEKVTIDGKEYYYDKTADILYDTTVKEATVTLTLNNNVLSAEVKYADDTVEFTNKKMYTKLMLTKTVDSLIGGDTEGEVEKINATVVFKITYTDIDGTAIERYASVAYEASTNNSQTKYIDKVPYGATVTVEEVYAGNYKPTGAFTKTVTLGEDEEIFSVEFSNEKDRTITGNGIINKIGKDGENWKIKGRVVDSDTDPDKVPDTATQQPAETTDTTDEGEGQEG